MNTDRDEQFVGNEKNHQQPSTSTRSMFVSNKQARMAFDAMNEMRKRDELCDVVINIKNGTDRSSRIAAHRLVLASCSQYFRAMFCSEMLEARQGEIDIHNIDMQTMASLVDFCYTGRLGIEENNVQTLLPAACLLQLHEVQEVCCEYLKRQLDPSNCLGIRAFADTHACRELLRIADKFTHHNFQEVSESEEFQQLPLNQLVDIIGSDELNVHREEIVFKAAMSWVRYRPTERAAYLPQVMQHIRLPLVGPKFLIGTVHADPMIKADKECVELVDQAKNFMLLPNERSNMQGPRTRPRKPVQHGEVLYAVGGWCSGDAIASVERMDPQTGEWRCVDSMSKRRCGVGVAVLHDLLYAVGGHDGQSYLNSVERYDPQTDRWTSDMSPTSTCRTSVGVAVVDEHIYAVGGQDGVSCLNVVERYDPGCNRWTKVAPMTTRRLGVAVAVLGGCLYAIGGSNGDSPLSSIERYDPRTNKWQFVKPMGSRRKHIGATVFNGCIYAVGGRDDTSELSSVEMYNHQANLWTPIVAMNSRRSGVGVCVLKGQMYAVGGFDGTTYLKTVEMFDQEANQWRNAGQMNFRRLGGGVGVIKLASDFRQPEFYDRIPGVVTHADT